MDGPFRAARAALGPLAIIAEDLGMITDEVHQLRDQLEFPGMRVFQFGFDSYDDPYHRPVAYPEQSVAYTGTHDNDPHHALIRAVLASRSDTAILPMQDVLGLGSDARMNVPGQAAGNWTWRCPPDGLDQHVSDWLRQVTEETGRI